jgi:outer membrane protein TolC
MKAKKIFLFLISLFTLHAAFAQEADSSQVLSLDAIQAWIGESHPLARAASLELDRAEAELLESRGLFDPKLYADWEQKHFDNKDYFAVGEGGLKIPTQFGVEFKATFQQTRGQFLNPMLNLPQNGQLNLGVSVNALQGLRIDEARSQKQQAEIELGRSQALFRYGVSELFITSSNIYWNWWTAYHQLQKFQEAVDLAEFRLEGIVESFIQGDKPAVDTLETFIQVQTRRNQYNDALIAYQQASLDLANFFGGDEDMANALLRQYQPVREFGSSELPQSPSQQLLLQNLETQHPELIDLDRQREQLNVEQRWAREQMLPKLKLEYNFLGNGWNLMNTLPAEGQEAGVNQLLTQNFKWGVKFEMPILFRKARGKLEQVKVTQTELKREQKNISLTNKVKNYSLELQNLSQQIRLMEEMVENYRRLFEAEQIKFDIGESSVFLLNSREQKLIESQLKLVKTKSSYLKAWWKLQWAAGVIVP